MTHKDIYTKFMIEYDKANVTSSYPSLTEYEAATILDKAYLALIGQKITGNNYRRAGLETDIKAVSDLAPLIVTERNISDIFISFSTIYPDERSLLYNVSKTEWDNMCLEGYKYQIDDNPYNGQFRIAGVQIQYISGQQERQIIDFNNEVISSNSLYGLNELIPSKIEEYLPAIHPAYNIENILFAPYDESAEEYTNSTKMSIGNYNFDDNVQDILRDKPIYNETTCILPEDFLYFVNATATTEYYGKMQQKMTNIYIAELIGHNQAKKFYETSTNIPWINGVVAYLDKAKYNLGDLNELKDSIRILCDPYVYQGNVRSRQSVIKVSLTYIKKPLSFVSNLYNNGFNENVDFECNDSFAEELISLAVAFALENVESQRLNSKLITRRLEA